ncbi:MAG: YbjQ family protein [Candidatus Eisenbacteria bacterium]
MILVTMDDAAGYRVVEVLGLVRGNTVRARDIGRDILAGFRNITGGEVPEYTKLLAEAREQAIDRMASEADRLGADGVFAIRMSTAEVMKGAAEIVAYGTAVRLEKTGS